MYGTEVKAIETEQVGNSDADAKTVEWLRASLQRRQNEDEKVGSSNAS